MCYGFRRNESFKAQRLLHVPPGLTFQQYRQRTYNVTLRRIRVSIAAVEK